MLLKRLTQLSESRFFRLKQLFNSVFRGHSNGSLYQSLIAYRKKGLKSRLFLRRRLLVKGHAQRTLPHALGEAEQFESQNHSLDGRRAHAACPRIPAFCRSSSRRTGQSRLRHRKLGKSVALSIVTK